MRARNLKPGFFKNEVLADIRRPWGRLLFAGLSLLADREGRLEDRPRRIQAEIFPYDPDCPDVDEMLSLLEASPERFIIRYEVNGRRYIQITNFKKHQSPHHTEKKSEIPPVEQRTDTVPAPCPSGDLTVDSPLLNGGNPPDSLIPDSLIHRCVPNGTLAPTREETPRSKPPAKCPARPSLHVSFEEATGWNGITEQDMENWKAAYPACDLSTELARAAEWVKANPKKHKKNWFRFLVNWLARTQERGGTNRSAGRKGDPETAWYYDLQGEKAHDLS